MVMELPDTDDVDPELFGLLHSISLEVEPTPSLTYLSRYQNRAPHHVHINLGQIK